MPPPIPVGVRLPLACDRIPAAALVELCRTAVGLGYRSFWAGDHVLLPVTTSSTYPHTRDGAQPFRADTPWADPLLKLTWLAAQVPEARFGTSVLVMTLRNPALLAKQISTVSWLTGRPFSLGVGSGWLREEHEALSMPFEHRATRARADIAHIKELLRTGERTYAVRDDIGNVVERRFQMRPVPPAPVEFLWGGFSPVAMQLIASVCDGWLPAKQSFEDLERHLVRLRAACDAAGRDFTELRLVAKPGPGPDPASGAVDADNLERYARLGFHEVILELPYEPADVHVAVRMLERVAERSWR